jgi:diguanylate cyclase (GGDEF)-like protein/PAS domain S-box-containing protein
VGERSTIGKLIAASLVAVFALLGAIFFEPFESVLAWVQRYERWPVDEIIIVSAVLTLVFGFYYSWRKRGQLQREVAERQRESAERERELAEHKRTEEELRRSEARYRAIVTGSPVALFALDQEGTFTLSEGQGLEVLGLEPGKVIGRSIFEMYSDTPQIVQNVRLALGGRPSSAVMEVDGMAFETWYSPFRENGIFSGVIGVVTDVTERKRVHDRLSESERRLSTLLSNAPAYLYRCRNEPNWPNEFVSDYALELTGYTPNELTDGSVMFGNLIVEEDRQRVWEEVQAALCGRRRFVLHYAVRRGDGEIRHVEESGQGVYREDGEVEAIEGVVYDVTERVRAEEALREAKERYRTLVEQIPAVIYIDWADGSDEPLYTSPQIEGMLGYTPDEWLTGRLWEKRLHPDDRERVLAADERFEAGGEFFSEEYRLLAKDGSVVWVREGAVLIRDEAGEPLYWQGVIFDVTERLEAEKALRRSEASLAEAQRIAHVGSWEWDPRTGELSWSDEIFRIYGFEPQQFVPTFERLMEVVHPADREILRQNVDRALNQGEPYDFEHRIVRPDGEVRMVHRQAEVMRDESGEPLRMVGTVHDITERKALEERLQHQALHDPLTGLPNRVLFVDRLRHALKRAKRRGAEVAVLFMDLDNFKVINDSLGHKTGDRVLVAASKRIRALLRPEDTVARFGGDEFVILLEELEDTGGVIRVAERISEELRVPFIFGGRQLFVTASIGIVTGNIDGRHAADLLRNADLAMYRAKHAGKARFEVFEEAMNARAIERLELGNDLRRALERHEFVLHYQPQVELKGGKIVGFEALLRWEHPERGLILPSEFVTVAEETGLIVPIGRWVLEEACRQTKEWQEQYPAEPLVACCINLSARQFQDPGLTRTVAQVLEETGLEPRSLGLEITESTAMGDAPATAAELEELQNLGVRVVIDDFGTGYSSLSYLERFPVDYIKIDRSFVDRLDEDPGAAVLVSGVIRLAHALGLKVIAEGVESAQQLEQLQRMRCDIAQGHLFKKSLPSEAAGALLETRHVTFRA